MSAYNQEFNKDNNVLRYITVALLAELRDKIYFYNQIDEDSIKKINVPFFYSVTGNERFLLDNFLYDAESNGKAIGDYEVVPRGILQLTSLSIDSSEQTNKFTRGEFVREFDGKLKTYSLETNYLPVSLSYNVTVVCSNNLEMLKTTESIISKLYKSTLFNVDLGMMRVQASMAVPESYQQDKLFEFSLDDKKEFQVTFDIEVKSFIPVFENGIILPEISALTKQSIINNPDADGVGMLRTVDGELGIYFGNVFQKFEYQIEDIRKAPPKAMYSNQKYVNTDEIRTGGLYVDAVTTSFPVSPESVDSKEYRNADDNEN